MSKNLISQNPVQRFKLGKQIQKFQNAGKIIEYNGKKYQIFNNQGMHVAEIREKSNGKTSLYPINSNLEKTILNSNSPTKSKPSNTITDKDGTMYTRRRTWNMAQGSGPMKWYGPDGKEITKETTLQNGYILNPKNATYSHVSARKKAQQNIEVQNQDKISENVSVNNTPKVVSPVVKRIDWGTEYQKALGNLTQTQKDYLTSLGADLSDVKSLQRVIGTKDDGMFGNNSNSALIAKLAEMPKDFGIKPATPELSGMNKVVVDWVNNNKNLFNTPTPYRTSNTYENADFSDRLKAMGIKSNADLIDFGWRTNGENYDWKGDNWAKQFRSDINQALGGDWSDQNIRKVFNTQGKWRGSRVGDFSDIQGVLQNNAGKWNGTQNSPTNQTVQPNNSYTNYLLNRYSFFKKNGGLLSKNPVARFKKGGFVNFRVAAQ